MEESTQPFSRGPGEGRALPTPVGGRVTFKLTGDESSNSISLFEFEVPAGTGPRLHVHEEREECIYVLSGELRVQLGDEVQEAPTGSCVFIPRGLPHRFQNVGDDEARLLGVYTPGGIEEFFESFAAANPRAPARVTPDAAGS